MPIPTPDKVQFQKTLNSFIADAGKADDALEGEYRSSRKIIYGDLDKDGLEDACVLFLLHSKENAREYWSNLAVFKNNNGKFEPVVSRDINKGQFNYKEIASKSIKNDEIYLETLSLRDSDPLCCPSLKGRLTYTLQGNKLIKAK